MKFNSKALKTSRFNVFTFYNLEKRHFLTGKVSNKCTKSSSQFLKYHYCLNLYIQFLLKGLLYKPQCKIECTYIEIVNIIIVQFNALTLQLQILKLISICICLVVLRWPILLMKVLEQLLSSSPVRLATLNFWSGSLSSFPVRLASLTFRSG